jgi:pimeloyl-ACP methyl ester carboxylesterase
MSTAQESNPATLFYGDGAGPRLLRQGLARLQALSPGLSAWLAYRFFITPLPLKRAARRRPVPAAWQALRWRLGSRELALWRRQAPDGEPDAARPRVLLVHGWAGDAQQLRPLGDALWAAGLEPWLLDLPAHGRSSGWQTHLPEFVEVLGEAGRRLGPLQGLVGHSLGALAASQALARGLLRAERLVLLACSAPPRQVLGWYGASLGLGREVLGRLRRRLEHISGGPLEQFEPPWLAARLGQPALLLHDRSDRAAPVAVSEQLAAALPAARLLLTEGLGHRRLLSDPATLAAVREHLL